MIRLKYGVKLDLLKPQMALAVNIAYSHYQNFGAGTMTVTSVSDPPHSPLSLHFSGRAVDLRLNNLSGIPVADRPRLVALIAAALGVEFDVLHEYVGTTSEHAHIEWDPPYTPKALAARRAKIRNLQRGRQVGSPNTGCHGPLKRRK